MTFRGFRIPVVLAVLVLTLAALLVGTHIYRRQTEVGPLTRQCAGIEGVSEVDVRRNGATTVLKLCLGPVADLRSTYREIEAAAEASWPRDRLEVVLADARTPGLEEDYHRVHYLIYEAAVRGTYSQLGQVEAALADRGRRARLSVDERFIYVQIDDGSGGYLYELVPLPRAGGEDGP